jgi:hypothetical protein
MRWRGRSAAEPERVPHPQTCEPCPQRYSEHGCPCWIDESYGLIETNIATGEERLITGCYYAVMPRLFKHVIAASNRPAAAVEDTRNEIVKGFSRVARVLGSRYEALGFQPRQANGVPLLGRPDKDGD